MFLRTENILILILINWDVREDGVLVYFKYWRFVDQPNLNKLT